jgi:thioredoxin-related protein
MYRMKLRFLLPLALAFVTISCSAETDAAENQPVDQQQSFWVTLEQAQTQARDQGKYILLDVYTEWCGFCRRMIRETYADKRVQEALDRYFYPVRIDAESSRQVKFQGENFSMADLALAFGVQSFPTTIFLNPDGEPVALQPGFIEPGRFHKMLSFVGSESYRYQTFQQYSESGK